MQDDPTSSPQGPAETPPAQIPEVMPIKAKGRRKRGRPKHKKLSRKETTTALEMAAKQVPGAMIARELGVSEKCISKLLKQFSGVFTEISKVKDYREVRGTLLDASELRLLKSVVQEDAIAKASLNNRAYALRQVHDMRRLEHGQSTANVSSQTIFARVGIDELKRNKPK